VRKKIPVISSIVSAAARFTAARSRPLSVLIVDDEAPVRKFVERVLGNAGYKTTTAADGPDALGAAKKLEQLDVLVSDVNMPQMTGDELARRLRQTEPRLKVLYLTGYSDQLFKQRSTLWQDEAFLDKPCSAKALLQAVSLLTSGRLEKTETLKSEV